jgi:polyisoprenoid-binding protein YceI
MSQTAVMTGTQWAIDPVHSEIAFKVKHLMISNVKGVFSKYSASITSDENHPLTSDVTLTIDPASINTGDAGRDQHLRTGDFFDVDQFPSIQFNGTSITKVTDDQYKLLGNLTMKGVTKPVTLDVEFGGIMKDPWGNEKAGLIVNGKINRKDWGLTYNAALETGGVLLGEEIRINAEIQLVKQ